MAVREGGVAAGTGQKELSAETRYTNVLSFGEVSTGGRLELTRYFRPFWHHKASRSNQPSELQ
ncbi:MAG: hypothetical protein JRJ14_10615 [Deltaproteobacteria bacterium]|nr:hypothetical protein [Deltaproteobacteria bacterium]